MIALNRNEFAISLIRFCDRLSQIHTHFPFNFFFLNNEGPEIITAHALMAEMAAINRMVNAAMTAVNNERVQARSWS